MLTDIDAKAVGTQFKPENTVLVPNRSCASEPNAVKVFRFVFSKSVSSGMAPG